jgi:hypothetical protein
VRSNPSIKAFHRRLREKGERPKIVKIDDLLKQLPSPIVLDIGQAFQNRQTSIIERSKATTGYITAGAN